MIIGPQKYEHRQLVRDLRGEDEDVRIFALRTVIQLEKGNLKGESAVGELTGAIEAAQAGWPEATQFYASRALEHLGALKKAFSEPAEGAPDEDLSKAPIELDDLTAPESEAVLRCLKQIELQEHTEARTQVVRMLSSAKDPRLICSLLEALAAIAEEEILMEVPRFHKNPNRRVRKTFVETLAKIAGDSRSGTDLVKPFLSDADGSVRAAAIGYLGPRDLGMVTAAIEATLAASEPADRAALADALARIHDEEATTFIRALSEDADETVRLKLLESLDRADHPQKTFVIKKLSKDPSKPVRAVASEAQGRLDAARLLAMGGFKPPPGGGRAPSIEEIHAADEIDPIVLDDLKKEDVEIKLRCLRKIRQRSFQKGHQAVFDLMGVSEDPRVLATVLRCLTVIGSSKDSQAVMHFLTHTAPRVRAAAAEAMNQLGSPKQILFLLLPMLHDADAEVQGAAAKAVLRFQPEEIPQALSGMAKHSAETIRVRLVFFLTHYRGDASQSLLGRLARDPSPSVRLSLARRPLELEPWADQIIAVLTADKVPEVAQAARQAQVARQRYRERGDSLPALPPMTQVFEVARRFVEMGAERRAEREAEELRMAAAAEAAELAAAEASKGRVGKLAGKMADDLTARKERDMIYYNRDMLLEALGKKLHALVKRREVTHADYERPIFLVDKYAHLIKQGSDPEANAGGLWGALSKMAGIEQEDAKETRNREKLRDAFVALGRVCLDLSFTKNVIHAALETEYLELEQIEKKIEVMEAG